MGLDGRCKQSSPFALLGLAATLGQTSTPKCLNNPQHEDTEAPTRPNPKHPPKPKSPVPRKEARTTPMPCSEATLASVRHTCMSPGVEAGAMVAVAVGRSSSSSRRRRSSSSSSSSSSSRSNSRGIGSSSGSRQ